MVLLHSSASLPALEPRHVGVPFPTSIPSLPPPRLPAAGTQPTVYPGAQVGTQVVWRQPQPPSLDDARMGKRADVSSLHDMASLHERELKRVSALMARQAMERPTTTTMASLVADASMQPWTRGLQKHAPRGMHRHALNKPSSRAEVVHLQATLRARLSQAGASLEEQVDAWDATFRELVRQVRRAPHRARHSPI